MNFCRLALFLLAISHEPASAATLTELGLPVIGEENTPYLLEKMAAPAKFDQAIDFRFKENGVEPHLFVLERRGKVWRFDQSKNTTELILDISSQLPTDFGRNSDEQGAWSFVFHPREPSLFLLFSAHQSGKLYVKLSRFSMDAAASTLDASLLFELQSSAQIHFGGALEFGPDGFLYVGLGDGGDINSGQTNTQKIDQSLFSGILRIDVDRRGGKLSHPIRVQPKNGNTANYFIPTDNPFAGRAGALEEFWAIGLRNPYRAKFDQKTKKLWIGEVGHDRFDEINVASGGENFQWSFKEGNAVFQGSYLQGKAPNPLIGKETPPFFIPQGIGRRAVIGGVVYRGTTYPDLKHQYIYGDYITGEVFALDLRLSPPKARKIAQTYRESIANIDTAPNGQIYFALLGEDQKRGPGAGGIFTLTPRQQAPLTEPPLLLSKTALYENLPKRKLHHGFTSYKVATPLEVKGLVAERHWLPVKGTESSHRVFVKTVLCASSKRPLETQISIVRHETAPTLIAYKWRESGRDADLVKESSYLPKDDCDLNQEVSYTFMPENDCKVCHTNKYPTRSDTAADIAGRYTGAFPKSKSEEAIHLLDNYCLHCHGPGTTNAQLFTRSPFNLSQILVDDLGLRARRPTMKTLIVPGAPDESLLKDKLAIGAASPMPPTFPYPINENFRQHILDWIANQNVESYPWHLTVYQDSSFERKLGEVRVKDIDFDWPSTENVFSNSGNVSMIGRSCLTVIKDTQVEFMLASDDGSFLAVGGYDLIDNGGNHARVEVRRSITLKPGSYLVVFRYFQGGGPASLTLSADFDQHHAKLTPAILASSGPASCEGK